MLWSGPNWCSAIGRRLGGAPSTQPEEDIVVTAQQVQDLIDKENDGQVDITEGND